MEASESSADNKWTIKSADVKQCLAENSHFRFDCTACGCCCLGPGDVFFSLQELNHIYRFLKLDDKAQAKLYKRLIQEKRKGLFVHSAGDRCLLLDKNNRCSVYPVRPLQCRSFPFWPSSFSSQANFETLVQDCPGCMKKNCPPKAHFSVLQTVRRVNKTQREFNAQQDSPIYPIKL